MVEFSKMPVEYRVKIFAEEIDSFSNPRLTNIDKERAIRRARTCARSILATCIETDESDAIRALYQEAVESQNPARASLIYHTFKKTGLAPAAKLREILDIPLERQPYYYQKPIL